MTSAKVVRVAAAQMLVEEDVAANLRRIKGLIGEAASKGCDLVCFPESCLFNDPARVGPVRAYVDEIGATTRDAAVWCLFGTYESSYLTAKNVAYLLDRRGRVAGKYSKKHLYRDEVGKGVSPGREPLVVRTQLGVLGVIICFDFAYPEYVKQLSHRGAEIILCPSFMVDHSGWHEMLRGMPTTRAFENSSYFVLCDAVTSDGRTAAISVISGPKRSIASISGREGMAVADLDISEIRLLRKKFRDLRPRVASG